VGHRIRHTFQEELREVLVRVGAAGGSLVGLLAGVDAVPVALSETCPTRGATSCFGALVPGLLAVLVPVAALAAAGALLGLLAGPPLHARTPSRTRPARPRADD
jgi:hypothetical protein